MLMTSGYVILDLRGYTPTGLGKPVTAEQAAIIKGNVGKPILLTGVVGQSTPAYIVPTEGVDNFTFNAYGYEFTLKGMSLKAKQISAPKATNVPGIAVPAEATAETNATKINAILSSLKLAGIMEEDI